MYFRMIEFSHFRGQSLYETYCYWNFKNGIIYDSTRISWQSKASIITYIKNCLIFNIEGSSSLYENRNNRAFECCVVNDISKGKLMGLVFDDTSLNDFNNKRKM